MQYIQLGELTQNEYIERFIRLYTEAVLNAYMFFNLYQIRQLTEEWIEEYNERRLHESLNNLTPSEWSNKALNNEIYQFKVVRRKGYFQLTDSV